MVFALPSTPQQLSCLFVQILEVFRGRQAAATANLVPRILDDVAAYRGAMSAATSVDGAQDAVAALTSMARAVPQSHQAAEADAAGESECPPPTELAHAVWRQLEASDGSVWLYNRMVTVVASVGPHLAVIPGGVKQLPRTVFKSAIKYRCNIGRITDQIRCTVVAPTLVDVAHVLRAMLDSPSLAVTRVKNRFAPDYDAAPTGGYLDLQTMVQFSVGGRQLQGEVQINLEPMLSIKQAPGGGHAIFKFARSLRAYDEATWSYTGPLTGETVGRVAVGAVLTVNLTNTPCDVAGVRRLARALVPRTARITELNLTETSVEDAGAVLLAEALAVNTTLKTLSLIRAEIGAKGSAALARALETNHCLAHLELSKNILDCDATSVMLGRNSHLETLGVNACGIDAVGAAVLSRGLASNATLQFLGLDRNAVGPDGARAIADAIRSHSSLARLNLWRAEIGDIGVAVMANAVASNTSLHMVNLSECNLSDSGAGSLAKAIERNTTLTKLDVSYNAISDAGTAELAASLKVNLTLRVLDLEGNTVGDDGAAALSGLADGGQGARTLSVELQGNRITEVGRMALELGHSRNPNFTFDCEDLE